MKKVLIFIIFAIFLTSLVFAVQEQGGAIKPEKRLTAGISNQTNCPENCTCSGSTTKCEINGSREMTIYAGKSGNIIVQVKGENMTTNVTLYKSGKKIHGIMKDNKTKKINMLPDQVKEKAEEKLKQKLEKYNISLDENGTYQVQTEKGARLFFLIPVREKTNVEINSETGEIVKIRNPWWGFLARDQKEQILGSSCGTVTPGENDECCQTKGYDYWDSEEQVCAFNI